MSDSVMLVKRWQLGWATIAIIAISSRSIDVVRYNGRRTARGRIDGSWRRRG